jgi:hypothetical protein
LRLATKAPNRLIQNQCRFNDCGGSNWLVHVPVSLVPDGSRDSRVILPAGINVTLILAPEGEVAVNGSPVKKGCLAGVSGMGDSNPNY